jgi:hypothetical protein
MCLEDIKSLPIVSTTRLLVIKEYDIQTKKEVYVVYGARGRADDEM